MFEFDSDAWSDEERYHIEKLDDAGLVKLWNHPRRNANPNRGSVSISRSGSNQFEVTFAGHEYLASVKDEGIWDRTKQAVAETGGSATLEITKTLAIAFLKKKLEDLTNLQF